MKKSLILPLTTCFVLALPTLANAVPQTLTFEANLSEGFVSNEFTDLFTLPNATARVHWTYDTSVAPFVCPGEDCFTVLQNYLIDFEIDIIDGVTGEIIIDDYLSTLQFRADYGLGFWEDGVVLNPNDPQVYAQYKVLNSNPSGAPEGPYVGEFFQRIFVEGTTGDIDEISMRLSLTLPGAPEVDGQPNFPVGPIGFAEGLVNGFGFHYFSEDKGFIYFSGYGLRFVPQPEVALSAEELLIEELREKIAQYEILLGEQTTQLGDLDAQVLTLQNSLAQKMAEIVELSSQLLIAQDDVNSFVNQLASKDVQIEGLQESLQELDWMREQNEQLISIIEGHLRTIDELNAQIDSLTQDNATQLALLAEKDELLAAFNTLTNEQQSTLQTQSTRIASLESQLVLKNSQIAQQNADYATLDLAKTKLATQLATKTAENSQLVIDVAAANQASADLSLSLDAAEQAVAALQEQTQTLGDEKAALQADLTTQDLAILAQSEQLSALQADLAGSAAQNSELSGQISSLQTALSASEAAATALQGELGAKDAQITSLAATAASLEAGLTSAQDVILSLNGQLDSQASELVLQQQTIGDLSQQVDVLIGTVIDAEALLEAGLPFPEGSIPGATFAEKIEALSAAISDLNPGQQQALLKNLDGSKNKNK